MNILLDENIPGAEHYFGDLGELRKLPGRRIDAAQLEGVDVLLVRSVTRVDRELLAGSPVRFVGSCTTGVDHVDQRYLKESGITFAHAAGANALSVVEYVLSALCSLSLTEGRVSPEMSVGILGLGNIGSRLYRLLSRIGFNCRAYDPLLPAAGACNMVDSIEQVLRADIVTLHTPLTRDGPYPTWHLLDEARLAALTRDCLLINSSRGAVVDNRALGRVLRKRRDLAVVLDVWESEPAIDLSLMARVDLATPHIAGYSYDGKLRGTEMVGQGLCRWLGVEVPESMLALPDRGPLAELPDWPSLCRRMLAAYNISEDDRQMRESLAVAENVGRAFELLRRDYPKRRELGVAS